MGDDLDQQHPADPRRGDRRLRRHLTRKQLGTTQAQLAEAAGLSQARISQIENGESVNLEILRAYVTGLGGHLDVVARIGNIRLDVA
ncbi:helix-turn-helix domain-containing protein [Micromonospora marina]|uniref:helix-turn-helix domain-containing protein n=1 Tax=Micromonospora marina TaxID=307120 RepID=UPI00345136BC